ncbi:ABC transporter permease subunit [Actinocrinis sp.]|uniref:ABC transporter permease subunit n=1 Tax=Actinocrinis sp. TaxID=1920516 RepID=UPI002D67E389|nr:ABC transporter permease subunit [Actinocrinis sp.]HZP54450.1 ABC transporter permease subunit [Actinocrinis sp.]
MSIATPSEATGNGAGSGARARANTGSHPPLGGPAARFLDLLAAEWIKFRSVQSTYWAVVCAAVPSILVGILIAQNVRSNWANLSTHPDFHFDALASSFDGFEFSQLVMGVLGVLVISSEYASGLIRATIAATPQRRAVLAAKTVMIGAFTLLCGEILAFAAFFPVQAIMHGVGAGLSIGSPGALRAVLVAGFYLAVLALIGLAFGVLLRHTAWAICAVFGLVFILPGVVSAFPAPWGDRIGQFLPTDCLGQLIAQQPHANDLSRPWSFVVIVAYPVVLLALAHYVLRKRDA